METALAQAIGVNGIVEVFAGRIRIKRKGVSSLFTHGLTGEKDIALSSISSVQFKSPGLATNGYIQFAFIGGREAKGGIFQAASDENTVMFKKNQQASFELVRSVVENQLTGQGVKSSSLSSLDELERLADLRDKKILSEEEFEAKKRQILGL